MLRWHSKLDAVDTAVEVLRLGLGMLSDHTTAFGQSAGFYTPFSLPPPFLDCRSSI